MRIVFFLLSFFLSVNAALAGPKTIIGADLIEGVATTPNYLKAAGHFEKNANGWTRYKDIGSTPTDGTGGSPDAGFTCARSISATLSGLGTLELGKDAANRQGNGCSFDFTIDAADAGSIMAISAKYITSSNYSDGDIIVVVYDVTNSTLISVDPPQIKKSTVAARLDLGHFVTTTSTSYRVILHTAGSGASAWTLNLDDVQAMPIWKKTAEYLAVNGTENYVKIQASTTSGAYALTLPDTIGSSGQFLKNLGSGVLTWAAAGSVTSVALTMPAVFTVGGSPVTSSGTLAVTANGTSGGIPYFNAATTMASSGALTNHALVLGGGAGASPTVVGSLGTSTTVLHGAAAGDPTFGAVSLTADVSGTLPPGNGGTGQTTIAAALAAISPLTTKGDLFGYSTLNTRIPIGTDGQVLTADSAQALGLKWASGGAGTVTSVALAAPATSLFGVSGSPVTSSGTLSLTTTGTSGGIPYFSSTSQLATSGAQTLGQAIVGGGAGAAPTPFNPTAGSVLFAGTSGILQQDNAGLFWDDSNNRLGIGTATPSNVLSFSGSVTNIIQTERHPTANTAGTNLRMVAGGATSGATNKDGGDLVLRSGVSTGTGMSNIQFFTASAGSSGTADNNPTLKAYLHSNGGFLISGTLAVPGAKLVVHGDAINDTAISNGSATIDFATGNLQYSSTTCGAYTLSNMKDGGAYTLAITSTSVGTCAFTASGFTVKLPPGHGATTSGKMTLYQFVALGTNIFVSWTPGY